MNNIFKWLSKHFSILQAIFVFIAPILLSKIFPVLKTSFEIPIWLLITVSISPLSLYLLFHFFFSKKNRKFKGGERVVFLHTAGFDRNFVDGYSFWNSKKIIINDTAGKTTTVHEDSVELFDSKKHAQIF